MSSTTKTILFVITKATWGGAQRNVYDLAVAAKEAGYHVLVAIGTGSELTTKLTDAGIPTKAIPGLGRDIDPLGDWRAYRALRTLIRKEKPDIVHAHSSKAGLLATFAARMCRVKRIVFTAHAWAYNEQRPWWQKVIFAKLHFYTVLFSHVTICVSQAVRKDARWMPWVQKRFIVVHNGINPITFLPHDVARRTLMPEETHGAFWIGSIAELHTTKGLDVLIRACATVIKNYPHTYLVVMGEGGARAALEALIREMHLEGAVFLLGHIEDAKTYLRALDIFTLPSRSEALGYALLEAGLAKLPVVASNVGGIPEIVTDGEDGLLVPAGNIETLATALTVLIENAAERKALGSALYERVVKDFSQEKMVRETMSVYKY